MPARLEAALAVLDTDRDGHIDAVEWEGAIESALSNKLEQRAAADRDTTRTAPRSPVLFR